MNRYVIRELATADLEDIWLYTCQEWGAEQADRYVRLLLARFSWIAENPLLGKPRDDVKPGYYSFPEGMHMVFYRIAKNGPEIIGIPHQNMDIQAHFESLR